MFLFCSDRTIIIWIKAGELCPQQHSHKHTNSATVLHDQHSHTLNSLGSEYHFGIWINTLDPRQESMGRFLLKLILLWIFACLAIHSSAAELTKVANPSTAQKKSPVSHGRKDAPPSTGESNNDTPSRNAIQLTAKTFSKEISDGNVWLIEFYTPW